MLNQDTHWWRGGVIYQIYPRSFFDSNNDGIGDLAGITQKLDYIANLGVDAIWISPFFTSPMKDFGYDVADYCDVDPIFGQLADFDALIVKAHRLGLKVIIDQVLNHTSDQHPWFIESRQSHDNPKHDWYVWADAKPDGTVPNNWLSVFGGSAWRWDSRRRQYYLHNFLDSQPDLNFHNPEVVEAIMAVLRFWLERGVDGFRLDTANYFFHDEELRDNPPKEHIIEGSIGVRLDNPYAYQLHLYDKSRPENIVFLQRIRALMDEYPNTTTVGEVGCDFALKTMAEYTQGQDKLHMCYSFDLLTADASMTHVRHTMETIESALGDGWPCWTIGNHDVNRVASRWAHNQPDDEQAKTFMVMLLTLRGSVCLYQGEELGLTEAELAYEELVDPYGINFWPEFKGRDGCRTPIPWDATQNHAGFSTHKPWLPVVEEHYPKSILQLQHKRHSILQAYVDMLALRKRYPALIEGRIEFIENDDHLLVYLRQHHHQTILVAINTGLEDKTFSLERECKTIEIPAAISAGYLDDSTLVLPRYSVYLGLITG